MSKTIERAIRRIADPEGVLPSVRLIPFDRTFESAYQGYKLLHEFAPVGDLQLSRWTTGNGRPITYIESLRIKSDTKPSPERCAAMLAILAMSAEEGRTLFSDHKGNDFEDLALWYWLEDLDLAVITTSFERTIDSRRGEALYSGAAYAPPVTLRG